MLIKKGERIIEVTEKAYNAVYKVQGYTVYTETTKTKNKKSKK